jgi:hypothetical protein
MNWDYLANFFYKFKGGQSRPQGQKKLAKTITHMPFDTDIYLSEKAIQFVNEFSQVKAIGLVGFKSKLKYYLSTLNNTKDRKFFIQKSLEILYALPEEDQKRLRDFIYVLDGTQIG